MDIKTKPKKNDKKKIALTVVGIIFACILTFGVSFILSFYFIINPEASPFSTMNLSGSEIEKENIELKEEIENLESVIEQLETQAEKNKVTKLNGFSGNAPADPPPSSEENMNSENTTGGSLHSQKSDSNDKSNSSDKKNNSAEKSNSSGFSPETTVTKADDPSLNMPASEDITIVEIP